MSRNDCEVPFVVNTACSGGGGGGTAPNFFVYLSAKQISLKFESILAVLDLECFMVLSRFKNIEVLPSNKEE